MWSGQSDKAESIKFQGLDRRSKTVNGRTDAVTASGTAVKQPNCSSAQNTKQFPIRANCFSAKFQRFKLSFRYQKHYVGILISIKTFFQSPRKKTIENEIEKNIIPGLELA